MKLLPARIMVVDDDPKVRTNLLIQLEEEGFAVQTAATVEQAWERLTDPVDGACDLLLLDIRLGHRSGVELVRRLAEQHNPPAIIIISGEATISETVASLQLGVFDFIEKPFTRTRLTHAIRNCLQHLSLVAEVKALQQKSQSETPLLGNSRAMRLLRDQIGKVAPTDGRVLILGESGTGKELVAAAVQAQSRRADGPFVCINCAALPATLIEDELFGHVRGAFTGAADHKPGLFEEAHRGTLFLDEIGDMEPALQIKLLRILEDGRVRRLGGKQEKQVDVRVIAATNRDLKERVRANLFREDLFYRLNSLVLEVPPPRKRAGDIPLLAAYFLEAFCRGNRMRPKRIAPETMAVLEGYPWPGNIRELKNVCERMVVLGGNPIQPHHLPSDLYEQRHISESSLVRLPPPTVAMSLREFKRKSEKEYIESVLMRTDGDITRAAELMSIQRTYLHRIIRTLGIRNSKSSQ